MRKKGMSKRARPRQERIRIADTLVRFTCLFRAVAPSPVVAARGARPRTASDRCAAGSAHRPTRRRRAPNMQRHTTEIRPNWQEAVESKGMYYHSVDGIPYWDESAITNSHRAKSTRSRRPPTSSIASVLKRFSTSLTRTASMNSSFLRNSGRISGGAGSATSTPSMVDST